MSAKLFRAKYTATRTNPQPEVTQAFTVTTAVDLEMGGHTYRWDGTRYVREDGDTTHAIEFMDGTCTYLKTSEPPPPAETTSEAGTFLMTGPLDPEPE